MQHCSLRLVDYKTIPQSAPVKWWRVQLPLVCWELSHTSVGTGSHLILRHKLIPLVGFSDTFPYKLTGTIAFLALLPPFHQDGFKNKTGKANDSQPNRAFVLAPLDVPLPLVIYSR